MITSFAEYLLYHLLKHLETSKILDKVRLPIHILEVLNTIDKLVGFYVP